MFDSNSTGEEKLRQELGRARQRLDGLARDLRAVDDELEGLSGERHRYGLLRQACTALEELEEIGAAGLFWGGRLPHEGGEEPLRLARGRLDAFEKGLGEIEDRRQALLEELEVAREGVELLEDDVFEAERLEEERRLEWVIERPVAAFPDRQLVMPWTRGGEDDERFQKALGAALLASLLLGLLLPLIELPLPEPWEALEVPDRLTRLIREERPLPPPAPVRQEELAAEEPPEKAEEAAQPVPEKKAESKGILAFREKFSGLAGSRPAARLGSEARIASSGEAASGRPQRSMVTSQAPGSSGGINLAALSRDVGGGGGQDLEGVQVAQATSSIGNVNAPERPLSDGPPLGRSDEEIQIVFDRHKAALYRLYNRELRRDPTLKGQMVLRIQIEPDGRVSLCELQSSDMKAPQLAAQVIGRVRTFDFGAKEVPALTILYPIDFLPAA